VSDMIHADFAHFETSTCRSMKYIFASRRFLSVTKHDHENMIEYLEYEARTVISILTLTHAQKDTLMSI
jgi:hypothetical protein